MSAKRINRFVSRRQVVMLADRCDKLQDRVREYGARLHDLACVADWIDCDPMKYVMSVQGRLNERYLAAIEREGASGGGVDADGSESAYLMHILDCVRSGSPICYPKSDMVAARDALVWWKKIGDPRHWWPVTRRAFVLE